MDRVKLKNKAREMIKGNLWYLWKPQLIFALIVFAIVFVVAFCFALAKVDDTVFAVVIGTLSSIISLVEMVFMVGFAKYCLDFVRGKKRDWKAPFAYIKEHFVPVVLLSFLISLIIAGGMILLIIPGIIFAIGHTFYQEVYVDNEDLSVTEVVSKSWNLTKGYKMDLFILMLSFIGWSLLATLTLGILYIWLIPYMMITLVLFYEELNGKHKKVREAIAEEKPVAKEVKQENNKKPAKKSNKKGKKK